MAMKLNHLHVKTKDPDQTVKFYVEMLGATIFSRNAKGGYRLDLHGLAINVTKFNEGQKREQQYGMEHLAIDTDDLEGVLAKVKDKGINILEQTTGLGGRRVFFFEGPDGVQLEFIEVESAK